jgi:hypothetical protein
MENTVSNKPINTIKGFQMFKLPQDKLDITSEPTGLLFKAEAQKKKSDAQRIKELEDTVESLERRIASIVDALLGNPDIADEDIKKVERKEQSSGIIGSLINIFPFR